MEYEVKEVREIRIAKENKDGMLTVNVSFSHKLACLGNAAIEMNIAADEQLYEVHDIVDLANKGKQKKLK